tara:strand:- start:656 stop:964 length:309 start_codon:yes stop_codon:yes gene_type:complete
MNTRKNSTWKNNFTEEFSLEEILRLKELCTAEAHTWTYQDRIGLKIYAVHSQKIEDVMREDSKTGQGAICFLRCTYKVANAAAKLLGVKHIIHIKHHYRSVK